MVEYAYLLLGLYIDVFLISYSMISTRIYMICCGPINSRPTCRPMPEIQILHSIGPTVMTQ